MSKKNRGQNLPSFQGRQTPTQQQPQQHTIQAQQVIWTSPLPPAEELEKYRQIVGDSPERILAMAEQQATHRQYCEKIFVRANARNSTLGVVFAFILGALGIGAGAYLLSIDKDIAGLTALVGSLGSLLFVYLRGSRKKPPTQG